MTKAVQDIDEKIKSYDGKTLIREQKDIDYDWDNQENEKNKENSSYL